MSARDFLARQIMEAVLEDLEDRRGFKHLLESIRLEDEETYQEIKDDLFKKITDILEAEYKKLIGN